ncbi:hypothetical protein [Nocardioides sp.]|uniref:hypothetical protein n=1 Tax=Nocardioides sp. TaxID=35761 RepID=UPI0031FEBD0B
MRSARGDLRYIAWGDDYRALVPILDYLTGARRLAERVVLRSRLSLSRKQRAVPPEAQSQLDELRHHVGDSSSGFMLYTGYYKTTWFVGPVRPDNSGPRFLKLFKTEEDARAEIDRSRAMNQVPGIGDGFDVVPGELFTSTAVAYHPVTRSRVATEEDALIVGSAIARNSSLHSSSTSWHQRAIAADRVSQRRELSQGSQLSRHLVDETPCSPSHGDVTPWNIVPSETTLTLVDYERVGHRPAFFDLVYAATHAAALADTAPAVTRVHEVLAASGLPRSRADQIVRAALSASIVEAVEDLEEHPENAARVSTFIRRKYAFLEAT